MRVGGLVGIVTGVFSVIGRRQCIVRDLISPLASLSLGIPGGWKEGLGSYSRSLEHMN